MRGNAVHDCDLEDKIVSSSRKRLRKEKKAAYMMNSTTVLSHRHPGWQTSWPRAWPFEHARWPRLPQARREGV